MLIQVKVKTWGEKYKTNDNCDLRFVELEITQTWEELFLVQQCPIKGFQEFLPTIFVH